MVKRPPASRRLKLDWGDRPGVMDEGHPLAVAARRQVEEEAAEEQQALDRYLRRLDPVDGAPLLTDNERKMLAEINALLDAENDHHAYSADAEDQVADILRAARPPSDAERQRREKYRQLLRSHLVWPPTADAINALIGQLNALKPSRGRGAPKKKRSAPSAVALAADDVPRIERILVEKYGIENGRKAHAQKFAAFRHRLRMDEPGKSPTEALRNHMRRTKRGGKKKKPAQT